VTRKESKKKKGREKLWNEPASKETILTEKEVLYASTTELSELRDNTSSENVEK